MAEEFDNTHTHTNTKIFSHLVICIDKQKHQLDKRKVLRQKSTQTK